MADDKMFDEYGVKLLKCICDKYGVIYHHHDVFPEPRYKDDPLLEKAICVVYSEHFGHWQLAINHDGTISRPSLDDRGLILKLFITLWETEIKKAA